MPRLSLCAALAALALPLAAAAEEAVVLPAAPDGTISFVLDGAQVGCTYVPAAARGEGAGADALVCTRIGWSFARYTIEDAPGPAEHERNCPVTLPPAPVLPEGATLRAGSFTCNVQNATMNCRNASGTQLALSETSAFSFSSGRRRAP
jgi:hypothetical protein